MERVCRSVAVVALAVAALAIAGCSKKSAGKGGLAKGGKGPVSVMVPCGQVGPFDEVAKLFEKQNPGTTLDWTPENMVPIVKKILDGKVSPDAVLSMGDLEMDQLQEAGKLLEATRVKIAENSLALITPADNPAGLTGIADLAKPAVKLIAIPDPKYNSVGKHALEALKAAGIWAQVEKKILYPQEAAVAKDEAARGRVQAAIAYYPCEVEVHIPGQPPAVPKGLKLIGMIPQDLYTPFSCEAAVLKSARNPEGARKLLALLQSPEGHELYVKWSFVNQAPVGR